MSLIRNTAIAFYAFFLAPCFANSDNSPFSVLLLQSEGSTYMTAKSLSDNLNLVQPGSFYVSMRNTQEITAAKIQSYTHVISIGEEATDTIHYFHKPEGAVWISTSPVLDTTGYHPFNKTIFTEYNFRDIALNIAKAFDSNDTKIGIYLKSLPPGITTKDALEEFLGTDRFNVFYRILHTPSPERFIKKDIANHGIEAFVIIPDLSLYNRNGLRVVLQELTRANVAIFSPREKSTDSNAGIVGSVFMKKNDVIMHIASVTVNTSPTDEYSFSTPSASGIKFHAKLAALLGLRTFGDNSE